MEGNGIFIWQLETINDYHTPESLGAFLELNKIRWVSFKLANGIYRYNQVGGNDKLLIDYMVACEAHGVKVGGWSYNYPEKAGAQAGVIGERVEKFSNAVKFDHWMVDIESEWKKPNLGGSIDLLLAISSINKKFPVGFCSYRYPELHAPLNFSRFLKNDTIKFNAPQVYWIGAHDVTAQLDRSFDQYAKLTNKPFVPIGAAFGYGDWKPTTDDLKEFVSHCISRKWYTYGWWSLDWVLSHNRLDWMEAISGVIITPPPPTIPASVTAKGSSINVRNKPNLDKVSDIGDIIGGSVLPVIGEDGEFWKVGLYVAKSVTK